MAKQRRYRRTLMAATLALSSLVVATAATGCSKDDRQPPKGATVVDLNGLRVQTISRGPAKAQAPGDERLTVLFLHGASYTSRIWDDRGILDAVVDAGYWAVAADLPGFGKTPEPDDDRSNATFLSQLIEAVGPPGQVVLVSPSKSGEWSLALLAEEPEAELAGFVAAAPIGISDFRRPADAPEIPALLVWGEDDDNVPLAKGEELAEELPGSTLEVVPGAGHAVYDDDPEGFLAVLLPFLAQVQDDVDAATPPS